MPSSIIIKNKTTWLPHAYIMQALPGITESYMCKARSIYKASVDTSKLSRETLPDTGKAWRWAAMEGTFYYAYNNIPDKAPAKYRSALPAEQQLISMAGQSAQPEKTPAEPTFKQALKDYYTYLPLYINCTKAQQINLAKAASLLAAATQYIRENNIDTSKSAFFNELAAFVKEHEVKYFPENARVIKRKIEAAMEAEINTIIALPRSGNSNASKAFHDEEIRSWVLTLRDNGCNYTNDFIIRKIQTVCELTGKPTPGDRWIGGIMEDHNTKYLTAQARYGSKGRFAQVYKGYQPFQNALFAGDCWEVDGTRVNLIEHKNNVTTTVGGVDQQKKVNAFLYIVAVRDVHSGDILGYNFSLTEDRWAVHNALKMAAKNAGYLPYEVVFDKFPGHNTPEMEAFLENLRQWGTKVTISSNPNAKPGLERFFGTLQTVFMQDSPFYYGQGVRSRRNYAHRSEEYIKRMRRDAAAMGFDWDMACTEAETVLENYRNTPYNKWSKKHSRVEHSPASLHQISERPHTIALAPEEYYYLFGLKVALPVDGAGLIKKTIQGVDFYYRTTDYMIFSQHRKVLVCYDMDDLSEVMLYENTDAPIKRFLGRAAEEVAAQRYGPDANWGEIAKRKALITEMEGYREQELEYRKAVGQDFDEVTLLAPTSVGKGVAERNETLFLTPVIARNDSRTSRPIGTTLRDTGNTRPSTHAPNTPDDDDDLIINPRNQY